MKYKENPELDPIAFAILDVDRWAQKLYYLPANDIGYRSYRWNDLRDARQTAQRVLDVLNKPKGASREDHNFDWLISFNTSTKPKPSDKIHYYIDGFNHPPCKMHKADVNWFFACRDEDKVTCRACVVMLEEIKERNERTQSSLA